MYHCNECGAEIDAERVARVLAKLNRPPVNCAACGKKAVRAYLRRQTARDRNAILRELCGTSAAAARRDGEF